MKIEWHKVTWYSWTLTIIVMISTIALGFYFTNQYQEIKRMNDGNHPVKNSLNTEDIKNATFNFGESTLETQTLAFKNGKSNFEFFMGKSIGKGEDVPNTRGYADISNIHITDIDGDGNQDAIAILGVNYGGSGYFEYLIFFINVAGKPVYKGFVFLGDRVGINSLSIDKGVITIDMIHDQNTGCCSPDTPILKLKFEEGKFVEIKDIDTSDWKTYKNEKYGFEFKYPAKLGDTYQYAPERKLECGSDINSSVSLNPAIKALGVGLSCGEDLDLNSPYRSDPSKRNRMMKIGGKDSYYFDYVSAVNYHNKEVYIPLYEGTYIYLNHSFKPGHPDYIELSSEEFEKILSTFKFTNTTSGPNASADQKISANCGFHVTNLLPNQSVTFPLAVEGVINNSDYRKAGCAWGMFEGTGGNAQLYAYDPDGKGKGWQQIGAPVPIFVENWATTTTKFKLTIGNDQMGISANTKLKIIFTEDNAKGIANPDTFELPLMIGNSPVAGISNWKTYKNEEYGFEIQYPPDWKVMDPIMGGPVVALAPNSYKFTDGTDSPYGLFIISDLDRHVTSKMKSEMLKKPLDSGWLSGEMGGTQRYVISSDPDHRFEFILNAGNDDEVLMSKENKMLSTFKFTK